MSFEYSQEALSNILRIRPQYFRTALSNEFTKKKDGKFIVKIPNISPQSFKIILRFIYCGKIDLSKLQGLDILKLLIAADELKIQTLILCIQEYLIKHQCEFLQQNPTEILETTDKLINLKAPLLELLLKQDDLLLDEIDIWDNLIKWSFAQHSSIQQDVKKWNKEDITIMERTLHRFISLKPNLDMQPLRQPKCIYDSTLIKYVHFAIFSSRIEKKNNFHYNGATVVVVKIKNSKQIVGGYNPLFWESDNNGHFKSANDSFIFSFTNRDNLQTAKIGYIIPSGEFDLEVYAILQTGQFDTDDWEVFKLSKNNCIH
ncbi:hypothetical protein C1645_840986 [Glomus cerebriforme]|uniref:BTB domain-containing protein n=1 Tax=Glomus cerebriforme TaxID=658196 RepID=A0A397RYJ1_9GLOM|nr:hypothetical protein C1645_840986 [Glomus cerebriforme]